MMFSNSDQDLGRRKIMVAVNFWKQRSKNVHSNVVHSVVLKLHS